MGIHKVLSEKGGRWTGNGKFIGMALAVSDAGIGVGIRSLDDQFDRQVGSEIYNFCFNFFYCIGENSSVVLVSLQYDPTSVYGRVIDNIWDKGQQQTDCFLQPLHQLLPP